MYTVGTGDTAAWNDIEVTNLRVKRTDFDKSPVVLTVGVRSVGLAGREAVVEASIGTRVVKSKTIAIEDDVEEHDVVLEFALGTRIDGAIASNNTAGGVEVSVGAVNTAVEDSRGSGNLLDFCDEGSGTTSAGNQFGTTGAPCTPD